MPEIKLRTKPDELCAQISEMARRLGVGAKLPTVRELGRSFGVSQMTLNVALGRMEEQDIISRRHGSGVFVAEGIGCRSRARNIVLLCSYQVMRSVGHSIFWDMLIEHSRERAASHNETCQLHLTNPSREGENALLEGLMADIRSGRVQGVLGIRLEELVRDWIAEQKVPLVTFAGGEQWAIGLNGDALIQTGVEQLAKQGCRRIGLWRPLDRHETAEGNIRHGHHNETVFRRALDSLGLPFDSCLIHHGVRELEESGVVPGESNQEQGFRAALRVFGEGAQAKPDGLFITDDLMTHGALAAFQKLGLRAGHDVKIASHANHGSPILMGQDDLTLIEFDPAQLVHEMFSMLETLMDGQVPTQSKVLIAPRLRVSRD